MLQGWSRCLRAPTAQPRRWFRLWLVKIGLVPATTAAVYGSDIPALQSQGRSQDDPAALPAWFWVAASQLELGMIPVRPCIPMRIPAACCCLKLDQMVLMGGLLNSEVFQSLRCNFTGLAPLEKLVYHLNTEERGQLQCI